MVSIHSDEVTKNKGKHLPMKNIKQQNRNINVNNLNQIKNSLISILTALTT
jgi:hypothetical protein